MKLKKIFNYSMLSVALAGTMALMSCQGKEKKDDKKDVIGSIIAILEGESSIEELKKRYNISLSDMTTRDTYINKLTNPDWRV